MNDTILIIAQPKTSTGLVAQNVRAFRWNRCFRHRVARLALHDRVVTLLTGSRSNIFISTCPAVCGPPLRSLDPFRGGQLFCKRGGALRKSPTADTDEASNDKDWRVAHTAERHEDLR